MTAPVGERNPGADLLKESAGVPDLRLARAWMCQALLASGAPAAVVAAMREVPREAFAPERWRVAYAELDLLTPTGWFMAAPTIARVVGALDPSWTSVCEFGTGPGYQAAVLARLGVVVLSVAEDSYTASEAGRRHQLLGLQSSEFIEADFVAELRPHRFDALIVNFVLSAPPLHMLGLINDVGGCIVPIRTSNGRQRLMRYTFVHGKCVEAIDLGSCRFPDPPPSRGAREAPWPRH